MELTIEQFEIIEAYLNRELPEGKKKEFEEKVRTNPEFRHMVFIQTKIRDGFQEIALEKTTERNNTPEAIKIREQILAAGNRYQMASRVSLRPFAMAASVIILLGFGWLYREQYYISDDARLAAQMIQATVSKSYPKPQLNEGGIVSVLKSKQKDLEWTKALRIITGETKGGKKREAKKILKRIAADSGHPQQKDAQELLEKL